MNLMYKFGQPIKNLQLPLTLNSNLVEYIFAQISSCCYRRSTIFYNLINDEKVTSFSFSNNSHLMKKTITL